MSEEQTKYEMIKQPSVSMFLNEERFEFAQRIGKMLAASTMIPDQFRNNLGNCLIALNMAERLGMDVFGLMQTSYVVHGRPGFEAKFLIALFNSRTQLFIPPLRWEFKGDFPKGQDAGCRAYAVDKETKEPLYGEWIDWPLIKAEGWDKKQGSKWLTIPGQMFRYRAASFFINAYEPGLKMGIQTLDEIEDMIIDVTPEPKRTLKVDGPADQTPPADPYAVQDAPQGKEDAPGPGDPIEIPTGPQEVPSFRDEWANLRGAGYSTYVHKNLKRIAQHPDYHVEMREKWERLYPEDAWPLNATPTETPKGDENPPPFDPPEDPAGDEPTPREIYGGLVDDIGILIAARSLKKTFDISDVNKVSDKQLSMCIDHLQALKEKQNG